MADVRATEKRMLADFVRERVATGGLDILQSLRLVAPGNEYQTLQKAITTTGTGASTADILAAINA